MNFNLDPYLFLLHGNVYKSEGFLQTWLSFWTVIDHKSVNIPECSKTKNNKPMTYFRPPCDFRADTEVFWMLADIKTWGVSHS